MTRTLLSVILALFVATSSSSVDAFTPPSSIGERGITSSSSSSSSSIAPLKLKGASNTNSISSRGHTARPATAMYAAKKKSSTTKSTKKKSSTKSGDSEAPVNFKKAEFVSAIAQKTGLTKSESEHALSSILSIITEELSVGRKRISLPGFGTFKLTYRAARKGRNPKTGEEIDIKESYSPSFTASKTFKDLCNPDR
ncbi:HU family DNA-binding protein [Skeletonema marinoi]|uniref:HU family DNA-binding protein n=1 Tax=Skeletonema marinoi TaxID=267567 RepID=A0AAD8Y1E0_9STRA|nr:HU family DNA-binding protein [Skeletonema marinoi]